MTQFQEVTKKKSELDKANVGLQEQVDALRRQIDEHSAKIGVVTVRPLSSPSLSPPLSSLITPPCVFVVVAGY